jgi:AcrR family transcriptional regulator
MARADPQLLEATAAAITRWGLRDTTLERIGAEAGLSRATMYRRGLSRDVLVAAMVEQATAAYRSAGGRGLADHDLPTAGDYAWWERNPRSRRLLDTTNTDERAMAAPASIGLSSPAAARGSAATL